MDTNNRLSGSPYQYDAAGNVTHDASHSYTYDAENRLLKVHGGGTAGYLYDAFGNRVRKTTSAGAIDYIHNLAGNIFSEQYINGYTGWGLGYVYFNGTLLAEYNNPPTFLSTPIISARPASLAA